MCLAELCERNIQVPNLSRKNVGRNLSLVAQSHSSLQLELRRGGGGGGGGVEPCIVACKGGVVRVTGSS